MNHDGLALACRYSYPPNSLSLCGPAKQVDLSLYSQSQQPDRGTQELLSQFSTLYPYLCLIASENHIADPFDPNVIEAYWIGSKLLRQVRYKTYIQFLDDQIAIPKRNGKQQAAKVFDKVSHGALPHHSFHVLNIYRRTGHIPIPHTIETMDACLIQWGKVFEITAKKIVVQTRPLIEQEGALLFGQEKLRNLNFQGAEDILRKTLTIGDWVSYHWGYICEVLSLQKLKQLRFYTMHSLRYANF